uniref:Secreted protein n=1 Tax=Ascaris lumbricoides TaxID=6252 RepID=A0A0M3IRF8_ASCLU
MFLFIRTLFAFQLFTHRRNGKFGILQMSDQLESTPVAAYEAGDLHGGVTVCFFFFSYLALNLFLFTTSR